ncbi:YraN family protein [Arabiibacter massiliensis]|uniref:YraN family protein n=1 Tax=Arabiibacter massiliensis TaxID=1870985 RepID=UPI0009BA8BFC|nr:YraN family protein [Arabiibacter massiliensis]
MVESAVADAVEKAAPKQRKKASGSRRKKGAAKSGLTAGERNAELGRRGEEAAARFLERRGYEIVARNWTCAAGEADIIARDGEWVVFVEVKTRSNCERGLPSEAVNADKRERYERIAACFLAVYDVVDVPLRFDIVSIVVTAPDRAMIRHHFDAFCAG